MLSNNNMFEIYLSFKKGQLFLTLEVGEKKGIQKNHPIAYMDSSIL